jgi:filamentous hemagglutinin family protein
MNAKQYKTIYSKIHGCLIAVAETASSQGKATGASAPVHSTPSTSGAAWGSGFCGALSTTFAFVTLAWASPAWAQPAPHALPTGGQVVQGAVQFNPSAQQLNILQSTDRAAVNWQSFDIGAAAKVNVVQPSAQSVLLNRVGGEAPSQIFGQLQANGQVILVNPNGMVFGKDGSVSAAGFTGSTLNISDADFMAGKERYTRSGTAAATSAIVNRGLIQAAPGGYVALLGASVSNEGAIVAPQGNVFMAAADAVTLPSPTVGLPIGPSGRIRLELTPASISAAVANHKGGTIVTEGGQVYLQAAAVNAALAHIIQSGRIDTTGVQGGQVHVLTDGGRIRVDGSIQANSTGTDEKGQPKAGGDIYIGRDKDTNVLAAMGDVRGAQLTSKGGFVETSGAQLKTDGISVSAKDWLLDPSDITISNSASSNVTGTSPADIMPNGGAGTSSIVQVSTIQSAINAGTNVTIKTTNASNPSGTGNITIANALSLNNTGAQDATLSLIADNGIIQNAAITATGSRLVHISMTANGQFQGINAASNSSRGVAINAGITTNGNITINGNANTTATGSGRGVHLSVWVEFVFQFHLQP